ncbi:MAG: ArsA-related P-loop ATPase [Kofleriaceae bacterium]
MGRLTVVIGKGGVGKTTVARGFAARSADKAAAPLVLELDGDSRRTPGTHNLEIEVADGDAALRAVAGEILGSQRLAGAMLSHFAVRRLAAIVPGLREVAVLVAAMRRVESGRHVILDMPATGHGVAWLDTVRLLRDLQPAGRARALIDELHAKLADPSVTKVVVVTLVERLVLSETHELCRALPRLPDLIVINGVHRPQAIGADVLAALARLPGRSEAVASLSAWLTPSERLSDLPRLAAATCEIARYPRVPTASEIGAVLDGAVRW